MIATADDTEKLLGFFKARGVPHTYQKNEFIIRPGETSSGVFYIHQGLVKAYGITKYNEENLLIIRKADEIFPLIWAITGEERKVVYQALAPTITWMVRRDVFRDHLAENPDSLAPILDMAVEMYRLHSERILNLEYRTVRERIISFLQTMGKRFGTTTNHGLLINVPLRHQDIASSINATRETTSRELSALERKGLITHKQSLIVIKDSSALQKYLD